LIRRFVRAAARKGRDNVAKIGAFPGRRGRIILSGGLLQGGEGEERASARSSQEEHSLKKRRISEGYGAEALLTRGEYH